jgi:DNA-binding CsgD family transcriptional regulator
VAGANRSALSLLRDGQRGVTISNRYLICRNPAHRLRLKQMLDELATAPEGQMRGLTVEDKADGGLLQISLIRLDEDEHPRNISIAAFISDPNYCRGPSIETLQSLYRLTRVEAEVVQLICQGYSPAKAAQKLRISVHTVRSYLKIIFSKIGVNRQADVVRLCAGSSAAVPAVN